MSSRTTMMLFVAVVCLSSAESFAPTLPLFIHGSTHSAIGSVGRRLSPLPVPVCVRRRVSATAASSVSMNALTAAVNDAFTSLFALPVLKTKAVALIHPIAFGTLYLIMLYAGYLGLHWRSVRMMTAGPERSKQLKSAVASRDRHFKLGSFLLGTSVLFAVEGCVNTWVRTGRLFATPHLFAGAGVAVLFALSAATVPSMQASTNASRPSLARIMHMSINALILVLFTWQLFTGWAILQKVWEFVPWKIATAAPAAVPVIPVVSILPPAP